MAYCRWDKETIDTVVSMWGDGASAPEIAEVIGKEPVRVRMFISRNRQRYDLERRDNKGSHVVSKAHIAAFEREWYGSVPFGHWTITKPWRAS